MKANWFSKRCAVIMILAWIGLGTFSPAVADPRLWGNLGVPVRTGSNIERYRGVVQDSAGNTLHVWSDERTGDPDIYAQLVAPDGSNLWAPNGISVVRHPAEQRHPVACATDGGFVIGWIDYRFGWEYGEEGIILGGDIYAQKLNYEGNPLWTWGWDSTGNPVDLDPSSVPEGFLQVVSDGAEGAMFAWQDMQEWNYQRSVYVTRFPDEDNMGRLEIASGLGFSFQDWFSAASGDNGSILIAWAHPDDDYYRPVLRAAKITPSGETPWGEHGTNVVDSLGYEEQARICSDGSDGAYITWSISSNPGTIWAQHVSGAGEVSWEENGVVVCAEQGTRHVEGIAASQNGGTVDGAVVIWSDYREIEWSARIYVQKITTEGSPVWIANGIILTDYFSFYPSVCSDLSGGLVASWMDHRYSGFVALARRVNALGQFPWGAPVVLGDTSALRQRWPVPIVRGNECYIGYQQETDTLGSIRVQKLDLATGDLLFSPAGLAVSSGLDHGLAEISAVQTAEDKLAIVWGDYRGFYAEPVLYFQMMDSAGQMLLEPNGRRLVPESPHRELFSSAAADGMGGFFVVFDDGYYHIRAAHVNAAGELTCDPAGVIIGSIMNNSGDWRVSYCASDGLGGAFVAYEYFVQGNGYSLHVTRLDVQCQPLWDQELPDSSTTRPVLYAIVADSVGTCVVVWRERQYSGPSAIRGARVNANGSVLWSNMLTDASNYALAPVACPDGNGGCFISYVANREYYSLDSLIVRYFSGQGAELWPQSGTLVSLDTLVKSDVSLAVNSDGDLIVLWNGKGTEGDYYSNRGHLYGQKLSPAGERLWGPYGTPLCSEIPGQTDAHTLCDNDGNFLAVWHDWRGQYGGTYGNYINADGDPIFEPYWGGWLGGPISDTTNSERVGSAFYAWGSGVVVQSHGSGVYVQRIRMSSALDAPDIEHEIPVAFTLYQNYPNPFNPVTEIRFDLPEYSHVELAVFNTLGQRVATAYDGMLPAGAHRVQWNGGSIASGLYIYQLKAGRNIASRKMVLLR